MKKALICMLQLHKASGSARTAYENIHYFKKRGYEVHVAAMTMDKEAVKKEGAIPHVMLPWIKSTGKWRRHWYNWQVKQLRKKLKPEITVGHGDIQEQDVITLHNSVFLASELIHGKPLSPKSEMYDVHGTILKNKGFKKLIANSELMKKDCIERFGIAEKDIHVVYPGLDTNIFFPLPDKKLELRKRFNFPDKIIVSLVTSGNFKKRGLDIFSEAIDGLPAEAKDLASFRVVGKDSPGSNLTSLLSFDPGLPDIENYFRAIDIFVLPARIEEFGRVVLEAMGCALPVITTDKVGAGELIEGEARNFVIPSHNSAELAKALTTLIQDKALRERIGLLNYQTAQKNSEEVSMERFDRVFIPLQNK